jgi:hypothetical protein
MAALLRLAAMFVQGVVHPMQMLLSRLPRACHTDATPDRLPATENGNQSKEQEPAATSSHSHEGLMLRDRDLSRRSRKAKAEAIVSNHEAVLTIRATRATTSPWKGEVRLGAAKSGWGSLRPAPTDQSEPHPSFASQKLTSPFHGEVKTALG